MGEIKYEHLFIDGTKIEADATFMHMKGDHMRNGQLKPGCDIQFGVKVYTELLLTSMAYEISKLHAKIQQKRTGKQLFKEALA